MKKLLTVSTALMALLCLGSVSQAQIITWGTGQNMVGDTDVSTTGSYFDAATLYGSSVTVNSVVFNPININASDSSGDITIDNPYSGQGAYGSPFTTVSPSSTNYSNLTSVIGFGYFNNGTVTLSNLTSGDQYQVQVWTYYSPGGADTVFTGPTGSNSVTLTSSTGQYALGTFTASGTSETLNWNYIGSGGNFYSVLNAVSVRAVTASPEPSTALLLGVGVLGMIILVRRKRQISA